MVKSQTTSITPAQHAARHQPGGADPFIHASEHNPGGGDQITEIGSMVHIYPMLPYSSIVQGTWVRYINVGYAPDFFMNNSSNTDGDKVRYKIPLVAGTYTIGIDYMAGTGQGICKIMDGATTLVTQDTYEGATATRSVAHTGVVIATAGLIDIDVMIDGKNGASGGHNLYIAALSFVRTA